MKIVKNELISIEESDIKKGVLNFGKRVKKVGDNFDISKFEIIRIIAPCLIEVGNYSFSSNSSFTGGEFPMLASVGNDSFRCNASLVYIKTKKHEFKTKNVDEFCFVIESEKTSKGIKIYSGYNFISMSENVINKQVSFVSEKDGFTAHGETIKKSISDLHFKIVSDTLKKEPIKKETIIDVKYYRLITGACDFGVKNWMKENGMTKESYKAVDLFPILKKTNAYGFEKFKQLITFEI